MKEIRSVGIDGCVGQYETDSPEEAAREGASDWFASDDQDETPVAVQVNDSQGSHYYMAKRDGSLNKTPSMTEPCGVCPFRVDCHRTTWSCGRLTILGALRSSVHICNICKALAISFDDNTGGHVPTMCPRGPDDRARVWVCAGCQAAGHPVALVPQVDNNRGE